MKVSPELIILYFAMGAVTYLPRWLPLAFLAQKRLPSWLAIWLDFIPAAILSALILPELVTAGNPRQLDVLRPDLIVSIPLFIFAFKTRSLGGTVIIGMALFWLVTKVL